MKLLLSFTPFFLLDEKYIFFEFGLLFIKQHYNQKEKIIQRQLNVGKSFCNIFFCD